MPKAIIICGCPASGKSSLASLFVEDGWAELSRDHIRFNDLKLGSGWRDYKFSRENEDRVHKIWQLKFDTYSLRGTNFVISDTMCKEKDRRRIANKLRKLGYDVIVVELHVPIKTLIERDKLRGNFSVGEEVIQKMYRRFNNEEV